MRWFRAYVFAYVSDLMSTCPCILYEYVCVCECVCIIFTQPLRSGRIWHKVNF